MFLVNGKIHTMEDKKVIENGYIFIEGDKIKQVGDMADCPDTENEKVIDVQGLNIYPGFIDVHCHVGMFEDYIGPEGDDGNEMTDPVNPQLRAIDALNPKDRVFEEALKAGVTSVVTGPGSGSVMSGQMAAMKTKGDRVDHMVIEENVAFKIALGENPKMAYGAKDKAPATRMSSAALLREALGKAKDYKEKLEAAGDDIAKRPGFDMKSHALLPLLKKEKMAHIHAHRLDDMFTAIRICREFDIAFVLIHCTEGYLAADELAKEGISAVAGPFLTDRSKPELKNLSAQNPGILQKHNISTAICTDHPVTPLNYLPLCAGIAVKEGMGYDEAIEAITCAAAKIVGIDNRVGSIKAGKDADIVVFAGDPLSVYAKPKLVVCNGEVVE